ncbi:MAG: prolyl oligopeptidase family serine peptidase [Pseudomonadales bacterium]|nr:prolyl oligopeptidase family serine peptidase [Pseudomonadales bacterium]
MSAYTKPFRVELTPAPFNVRSRVHEYGGGSYLVTDQNIFFINFSDQNIYQLKISGNPSEPIDTNTIIQCTHSNDNIRFTDLQYHIRTHSIICVQEHHAGESVVNSLVSINLNSGLISTISSGHDFYSSPRISPDSTQLLFLSWDHPDMPWDSTLLYLADFLVKPDRLELGTQHLIAGNKEISICQPEWLDNQQILFSSDESGWWNLKRYTHNGVQDIFPDNAEYGLPHWVFGMRFYAIISNNLLACIRITNGSSQFCLLDINTATLSTLEVSSWQQFSCMQSVSQSVFCIAGSPDRASTIIEIDCSRSQDSNPQFPTKTVIESQSPQMDPAWFSIGQTLEISSQDDHSSYGYFYPPQNPNYNSRGDITRELPPLLVLSHGGPTDCARRNLNLKIQYYTSRGWAVFDSNYAGSTGFGRKYRERLVGNWGLSDVKNCVDAATYLSKMGYVDKNRVAIKGSSAGGYTTLAALTFSNIFRAGASHYGIGDLEALAKDTHKFEAHYMDSLVGPYPQQISKYKARSPLNHTEQLSCPVIFFQGLDDKVVPPNQAEAMVDALKKKRVAVAYLAFEGEGHGFRQAAHIRQAIESEYQFFSRIFGFQPAETLPEVEIFNLPSANQVLSDA